MAISRPRWFSEEAVKQTRILYRQEGLLELEHDLRQIRRLIQSDTPLTPEARIQPGTRVRIRSGSLAGMEGMVIKRRGVDRLLIMVKFLQQGASIQIEDFQVESLDG